MLIHLQSTQSVPLYFSIVVTKVDIERTISNTQWDAQYGPTDATATRQWYALYYWYAKLYSSVL